jgi:hypothetical protein
LGDSHIDERIPGAAKHLADCQEGGQEKAQRHGEIEGQRMAVLENRGLAQWLTPIIPATQEAEIGRITVLGQPWVKSRSSYLKNNLKQKGMEAWLKWDSAWQTQGPEFKP